MELFPAATSETYSAVLSASQIDEDTLKNAIKELKLWLQHQPHLPHEFDEKKLSLFYLRNKKRMKKTKEGLEAYYTMRFKYPEIMCDRDPWEPWFTQASETVYCIPLPQLTEDHSRVIITGNFHSVISSYNIYDILKMDFMVQDLRILEEFTPFDTVVIDCANTSVRHFSKFTLPLNFKIKSIFMSVRCHKDVNRLLLFHDNIRPHTSLYTREETKNFLIYPDFYLFGPLKDAIRGKRYGNDLEVIDGDGFRTRIHSLHFINAPIYLEVTMKLLKFVFKPKLFKRIHVHKELGTLHESVPAKILPNEYGGEAGSVHDIWNEWKQKIVSKREWFLRQEKLKTDISQSS